MPRGHCCRTLEVQILHGPLPITPLTNPDPVPTVVHADEGGARMALTLAEGAKLSNDVLLEGVIETAIVESPVLQRLPFIEIVGNGLTYNRENAAATAEFYAVGGTWTEGTPTFTQQTAVLKILGGDADVDHY